MQDNRLVELVPNISEGRDSDVLREICRSVSLIAGVKLLHVDTGYDAHRTVLTLVSPPEVAVEVAYRLVEVVLDAIDMRLHAGEHPRLGAVDILPFIPLRGLTLSDCVTMSHELAQRVATDFNLPVYLYEESASSAYRRPLSAVRRGEFEGLSKKMKSGERWLPDYGPSTPHPSFGALVTGARRIMLAYNVSFDGGDLHAAKEIASRIRERGAEGGLRLKGVKAIGWHMPEYDCFQVSTNLMRPGEVGLLEVYDACKTLAAEYGLSIRGSELIGLVPEESLLSVARVLRGRGACSSNSDAFECAVQYLGLRLHEPFVVEDRVLESLIHKT